MADEMMTCPSCGGYIPKDANTCPSCGTWIPQNNN